MPALEADVTERLLSLRQRHGLTQARLADFLGVSFPTVNRWENGKSKPSKLALQKIGILESYGVDALTKGVAEPPPPEIAIPSTADSIADQVIDFSANPEIVRTVAEGERLSCGHQINPAFATEISLVDPLPHQRIAVYERMLNQSRLRFLLADDAGAGKTIMTGLYIREMLARRFIRRILIVTPAGLVSNWRREMRGLFSLPFEVVRGSDAKNTNPFVGPKSDLLIVSVDTLSGDTLFKRFQEMEVSPYDLVVFDEAHKLSADREPDGRIRKTDRYRLAECIAGVSDDLSNRQLGWRTQHLLLLTATPHMGKDYPYFALWRLLMPEILSTKDAFDSFPSATRQQHFIRRTKEEMVHLDGRPLYPVRISDTLSFDLSQGEISEQALYDKTTEYIRSCYNRARILNRSAARFAMGVFQRRLASSTWAILRSFERRIEKLEVMIDALKSGDLDSESMAAVQRRLDENVRDLLDEFTADEEKAEDGTEEHDRAEEEALQGVVAVSLAELEEERQHVEVLRDLARQVYDRCLESKFEKLLEQIRSEQNANGFSPRDEKIIIFTEHRDTLDFIVRRLEGMGFTGRIAQIHGGLDYVRRDEQIKFFKKPIDEGGAQYFVATDAAGEGINLQFCWIMINYDIPWNPARLEQRMGRIHRYGQKHDPVIILNLVAGTTREGQVLAALLRKLEAIRKALKSDKVFDVVGRLFQGLSIKDYMEAATTEKGAAEAIQKIEGRLTKEQVKAIEETERTLYGDGGDVKKFLPRMREEIERETYRRLMPGYIRRFLEKAVSLANLDLDGDIDSIFALRPLRAGAFDPFWPLLELYADEQRNRFSVHRPAANHDAIWLHPGEPFFEQLRSLISDRFSKEARKGAVFIDPAATRPYMFHLFRVSVRRSADLNLKALGYEEVVEHRLVGVKHEEEGGLEQCPVESLILLHRARQPLTNVAYYAHLARTSRAVTEAYARERIASPMAQERRRRLLDSLPERESFIVRGFDYQDAELLARRAKQTEKARAGDPRARGELTRIKDLQRSIIIRRDEAIAIIRREPELIEPGAIEFIAHALVLPSSEPEDVRRHDAEVETIAVRIAMAHEQTLGANVFDVSNPERARAAGLTDWPGFDLLSRRPDGTELAIEVKGRARTGEVEVSENEWAKACNLRNRYWLYVVFDCATHAPRLMRVQDPFGKLLVKAKGGVTVDANSIIGAAADE